MSSMDIIVVGAGSVGANVAYRLAERGARVTVLEAGAPGGGTSGPWVHRSPPSEASRPAHGPESARSKPL